jgi:hypothetical protein
VSTLTTLEFTALVALSAVVAGLLGSLTGLGGGVVLVPLLTLVFRVDIRYAVGASLVSVIATSSGAAAAYVKEGFSNIRVGYSAYLSFRPPAERVTDGRPDHWAVRLRLISTYPTPGGLCAYLYSGLTGRI